MKIILKRLLTKVLSCCFAIKTSGNWVYREYPNGLVEAWYYGVNVPYSGVNTTIAAPHTIRQMYSLTADGVLNGYAQAPLNNLWYSANSPNIFISFIGATGSIMDRLSIHAVYKK